MSIGFVLRLAVLGLLAYGILLGVAGLYGFALNGGQHFLALATQGGLVTFVTVVSLMAGRRTFGTH